MNSTRKLLVYALVLLFVGGHVFCYVTRKDPWPFSCYGMYSAAWTGDEWRVLEVAGIPANEASPEFRMPDEGLTRPRSVRVLFGLRRVLDRMEHDPSAVEQLRRAADGVAVLFERQRLSGNVDIEPIRGIRIYEQTWRKEKTLAGPVWTKAERIQLVEGIIESKL